MNSQNSDPAAAATVHLIKLRSWPRRHPVITFCIGFVMLIGWLDAHAPRPLNPSQAVPLSTIHGNGGCADGTHPTKAWLVDTSGYDKQYSVECSAPSTPPCFGRTQIGQNTDGSPTYGPGTCDQNTPLAGQPQMWAQP
jgi:hypothetical protein